MGRKRLPTEVKELRKIIRELELEQEKNKERMSLLAGEVTEAYKASSLYKQMEEQISWYKNLYLLEQTERQMGAGRVEKLSEEQILKIKDAEQILQNKTKDTFFSGITQNWVDAKERSTTLLKCRGLETENRILSKQLREMTEENERLVMENALLKYNLEKAGTAPMEQQMLNTGEYAKKITQTVHEVIKTGKRGRPSYRTEAFCNQVIDLYGELHSMRKVAAKLDIALVTVQRIIKSSQELDKIIDHKERSGLYVSYQKKDTDTSEGRS